MAAQISMAPDVVFSLGGIAFTNSMLAAFLSTAFVVLFAFYLRLTTKLVPTRLQVVVELIFTFFLEQLTQASGSEKYARRLLPLVMTFFLLILIGNSFGFIPLVSMFLYETVEGTVPFFRTPTADYSATVAFALMVVVGGNLLALYISPLKHISNYIRLEAFFKIRKPMDVLSAFIELFLGFMEIVSEVARVVSLATRLFGNVFAGEVVVAIIMSLMAWTAYFVPIPFILLSTMGGIVQAFVFALLMLLGLSSQISNVSPSRA